MRQASDFASKSDEAHRHEAVQLGCRQSVMVVLAIEVPGGRASARAFVLSVIIVMVRLANPLSEYDLDYLSTVLTTLA